MKSKIRMSTMKRLAVVESDTVKHFIRSATRLYQKIALREQFNLEAVEGFSSYEMVNLDHEELCREIGKDAGITARTLCRLNRHAEKRGFGPVLKDIEEMSLTEIISSVVDYVERLVAESDYQMWLDTVANPNWKR